jgi:spore coat protein U-like protein
MCPSHPAECQVSAQTFDFGRGQMTPSSQPILGTNTLSVTCTRALVADGLQVDVSYRLKAVPAEPIRFMRDRNLEYLSYGMYVDPTRTRLWGDGISYGTFTFEGSLSLDNRNRTSTVTHQVYGKVDGGQIGPLPGQWLGLTAMTLEYEIVACF